MARFERAVSASQMPRLRPTGLLLDNASLCFFSVKAGKTTFFHRHPCSRIGHQPGLRPFQTHNATMVVCGWGTSSLLNLRETFFYENPKIHVLIRKSCCTFPLTCRGWRNRTSTNGTHCIKMLLLISRTENVKYAVLPLHQSPSGPDGIRTHNN